MSKVFIIVHANSVWNELGLWQGHCDTELSETGHLMSQQLAERSDLNTVKQIYSSDLKRAYQTVEPLADRLNLNITKNPYLREGRWEDHDTQIGVPVLPAPYDYESRERLTERAVSTLQKTVKESEHFPILIATHGTFLECFIHSIQTPTDPVYEGIRAAVNIFESTHDGFTITQLNDGSHLGRITNNMICVTDKPHS